MLRYMRQPSTEQSSANVVGVSMMRGRAALVRSTSGLCTPCGHDDMHSRTDHVRCSARIELSGLCFADHIPSRIQRQMNTHEAWTPKRSICLALAIVGVCECVLQYLILDLLRLASAGCRYQTAEVGQSDDIVVGWSILVVCVNAGFGLVHSVYRATYVHTLRVLVCVVSVCTSGT